MSLKNTHPEFQRKIAAIADFTKREPESVYLLWRRYSQECTNADQSAILGEFGVWYHKELGVERIPLQDFITQLECGLQP